jgi:hypothetical protein
MHEDLAGTFRVRRKSSRIHSRSSPADASRRIGDGVVVDAREQLGQQVDASVDVADRIGANAP